MSDGHGRWRRGWWWKAPLVLLVLLVFFAPTLATPFVRDLVVHAVEESTQGRASFESFRLGWPARLEARGLRITDSAGRPLATVSDLEGTASPAALLGRCRLAVLVSGAELHLWQREDGSWDPRGDVPRTDGDSPPEAGDAPPAERPGPAPDERRALGDVSGKLRIESSRIVLHGRDGEVRLDGFELALELPEDGPASYGIAFDASGPEAPAGSFRSTGELEPGGLEDPTVPLEGSAALTFERLTLGALAPLLAAWIPERVPGGTIDGAFELRGTPAALRLAGSATVTDFEVEIPSEEEPLVVREPRVELGLDLELATESRDLSITKLSIVSGLVGGSLSGRARNLRAWGESDPGASFEGLSGELVYQPDRLGALLAPWLPFELSGEGEEHIAFQLDGTAAKPDLASVLAGCRTEARIGLGTVQTNGLSGSGELEVSARDGVASWSGDFRANGGALALSGTLAAASTDDGGSVLSLDASEVQANSRLAPLLELIHPAFAAVESLKDSEIGGLVTCDLDLSYDGPLSGDVLSTGGDGFPVELLRGKGSFGMEGLHLRGSPALVEMLGYLGIDTSKSVALRPIAFTIEGGRLTYDRPWTWTFDGVATTFAGSVGFDHTLDLSWSVPITDQVVAKHGFLSALRGQEVRLPITGTVEKPSLEWRAAIEDLATKGVQEELQDELLGRLGVHTGRDAEGEDPASLLAKADRLWQEGKKSEAAEIYRTIREKHKVSLVYALNRDRIKERGFYRE